MLRDSEGEKEILLGNKQLFGIFFAVAVLLGIAFAGGYMVGKGTVPKTTAVVTAKPATSGNTSAEIGETHSIPADSSDNGGAAADAQSASGSGTAGNARSAAPEQNVQAEPAVEGFNPAPGERFLQVAAVSREEADAVAEVLHKKGFHAHAAPKPGDPRIYRVLVGPIRDAGDLSATRDALRRTGFSEVITQRY